MNNKLISYLKWSRLVVGFFMLLFVAYNQYLIQHSIIVPASLIMTGLFALFVFCLGLEYHLARKPGMISVFLMLFSIIMLISVGLGLIY